MTTGSEPNELREDDYRALAEFRYQIRRFLRFSEQAAREAGLEPQHHQLLLAIKGLPLGSEARVGVLAERLQLQHHSAVELVERLVQKGLITKARGSEGGREGFVQLTAAGERVLSRLTLHHRDELRSMAPALASALRRIAIQSKPGRPHRRAARAGKATASAAKRVGERK